MHYRERSDWCRVQNLTEPSSLTDVSSTVLWSAYVREQPDGWVRPLRLQAVTADEPPFWLAQGRTLQGRNLKPRYPAANARKLYLTSSQELYASEEVRSAVGRQPARLCPNCRSEQQLSTMSAT